MSQDVLAQAQTGDPKAIERLMNHTTRSRGIRTRVASQDGYLHILFESDRSIDQDKMTTFVRHSLVQLRVEVVSAVMVYGRQQHQPHVNWTSKVLLESEPAEDSVKDIPEKISEGISDHVPVVPPMAPESENHDLTSLLSEPSEPPSEQVEATSDLEAPAVPLAEDSLAIAEPTQATDTDDVSPAPPPEAVPDDYADQGLADQHFTQDDDATSSGLITDEPKAESQDSEWDRLSRFDGSDTADELKAESQDSDEWDRLSRFDITATTDAEPLHVDDVSFADVEFTSGNPDALTDALGDLQGDNPFQLPSPASENLQSDMSNVATELGIEPTADGPETENSLDLEMDDDAAERNAAMEELLDNWDDDAVDQQQPDFEMPSDDELRAVLFPHGDLPEPNFLEAEDHGWGDLAIAPDAAQADISEGNEDLDDAELDDLLFANETAVESASRDEFDLDAFDGIDEDEAEVDGAAIAESVWPEDAADTATDTADLADLDESLMFADQVDQSADNPWAELDELQSEAADRDDLVFDDPAIEDTDESMNGGDRVFEDSLEDSLAEGLDQDDWGIEEALTEEFQHEDLMGEESDSEDLDLPDFMVEDASADRDDLSFEESLIEATDSTDLMFEESVSEGFDLEDFTPEESAPEGVGTEDLIFEEPESDGLDHDDLIFEESLTEATDSADLIFEESVSEGFDLEDLMAEEPASEGLSAEDFVFEESGLADLESDDLVFDEPLTESTDSAELVFDDPASEGFDLDDLMSEGSTSEGSDSEGFVFEDSSATQEDNADLGMEFPSTESPDRDDLGLEEADFPGLEELDMATESSDETADLEALIFEEPGLDAPDVSDSAMDEAFGMSANDVSADSVPDFADDWSAELESPTMSSLISGETEEAIAFPELTEMTDLTPPLADAWDADHDLDADHEEPDLDQTTEAAIASDVDDVLAALDEMATSPVADVSDLDEWSELEAEFHESDPFADAELDSFDEPAFDDDDTDRLESMLFGHEPDPSPEDDLWGGDDLGGDEVEDAASALWEEAIVPSESPVASSDDDDLELMLLGDEPSPDPTAAAAPWELPDEAPDAWSIDAEDPGDFDDLPLTDANRPSPDQDTRQPLPFSDFPDFPVDAINDTWVPRDENSVEEDWLEPSAASSEEPADRPETPPSLADLPSPQSELLQQRAQIMEALGDAIAALASEDTTLEDGSDALSGSQPESFHVTESADLDDGDDGGDLPISNEYDDLISLGDAIAALPIYPPAEQGWATTADHEPVSHLDPDPELDDLDSGDLDFSDHDSDADNQASIDNGFKGDDPEAIAPDEPDQPTVLDTPSVQPARTTLPEQTDRPLWIEVSVPKRSVQPTSQQNADAFEPRLPRELEPADESPISVFNRPEAVVLLLFVTVLLLWQAYQSLISDAAPDGSLTVRELARRLDVNPSTINRRKAQTDFPAWSQFLDPVGIAWVYVDGVFLPQLGGLHEPKSSTSL